jgi:hypothetical protein
VVVDFSDILRTILANRIEWIVVVVGTAAFGLVEKKWPNYRSWIISLLGVATALAVLTFMITGHSLLAQPGTTIGNIQSNMRDWADKDGLGIKKDDNPTAVFQYEIILRSNAEIFVAQAKNSDYYLRFSSHLGLDSVLQSKFKQLNVLQQQTVSDKVELQLAMMHVAVDMNLPYSITLKKVVPITTDLTESAFTGYLNEVDWDIAACTAAVRLSIAAEQSTK